MSRFLINIAISVYAYLYLFEAVYVIYDKKTEHIATVISLTLCMLIYWIVRHKCKKSYMQRQNVFISVLLFVLYAVYFYKSTDVYSLVTITYLLVVFSIPNTLFVFLLHKYHICTDYFYDEIKMFGENCLSAIIYSIGVIMQDSSNQIDSTLLLFILLSHTITVTFFFLRYLMVDD